MISVVLKETTDDERRDCMMTIGYLPSLNQISSISQTGLLDVDTSQLVSMYCLHPVRSLGLAGCRTRRINQALSCLLGVFCC